jgi:hypothetical protein
MGDACQGDMESGYRSITAEVSHSIKNDGFESDGYVFTRSN